MSLYLGVQKRLRPSGPDYIVIRKVQYKDKQKGIRHRNQKQRIRERDKETGIRERNREKDKRKGKKLVLTFTSFFVFSRSYLPYLLTVKY